MAIYLSGLSNESYMKRRWLRTLCVFCTLTLGLLLMSLVSSGSQSKAEARPDLAGVLRQARDAQDTGRLQLHVDGKAGTGAAMDGYSRALASSYLAEVYLEQGKKAEAATAAEKGIDLAKAAVQKQPNSAEYHRLLGTLCGQIIPANLWSAVSYGQCAREEIETALKLNPKLPEAYLGRGIGNYYLPPTFGGGIDKAISDFRKAAELAPGSSDVHLWLGIALRKAGDNAGARQHLSEAAKLSPNRAWIQNQIAKTPQAVAK